MRYYGMCSSVIMYLRSIGATFLSLNLCSAHNAWLHCMFVSQQATTLYISCNVSVIQF